MGNGLFANYVSGGIWLSDQKTLCADDMPVCPSAIPSFAIAKSRHSNKLSNYRIIPMGACAGDVPVAAVATNVVISVSMSRPEFDLWSAWLLKNNREWIIINNKIMSIVNNYVFDNDTLSEIVTYAAILLETGLADDELYLFDAPGHVDFGDLADAAVSSINISLALYYTDYTQ